MVKSLNIQQKINTPYLNKVLGKLYALEYENKVYNTIISDIIYKQNSPHFIRSFSKENTCTYDDLLDILNTTESSVDPQENLNRNTMYIFYGIKDRPSINFEDEEVRLFDTPILAEKSFTALSTSSIQISSPYPSIFFINNIDIINSLHKHLYFLERYV